MKKIKGFTLMELIIVMAILAVLMTAIIQMFKPIRETYVDATLYESQRSTQNGITQYITESVRYSTDLGLYTKNKSGNVVGAVEAFATQYCIENGMVDKNNPSTPIGSYTTADVNKVKEKIKRHADVIIVDHDTAYAFNNVGYYGRLLRRKFIDTTEVGEKYKVITNDAEDETKAECRMALGPAYYGGSSFAIVIRPPEKYETGNPPALQPLTLTSWQKDWTANYGIDVSVTSQAHNSLRKTFTDGGQSRQASAITTVDSLVLCKNLCSTSDYGVQKPGMFDTSKYYDKDTDIATSKDKIYIVFLSADAKKEVKAAI